ncbi:ATP-binding protein [Planobispora siamensis]|uniref:histidine kinase n=1 Tax=Planobispora siamensis TaxID=936338 RepID=A0A8J3SFV7_9ACTN|nr:ATP-binding protein [Planobispora siamensis]GIH93488.1 hypothetical protein Psi01_41180 [Planobispora siamensis]
MEAIDHVHDARRAQTLHATGLLGEAWVPLLDRVTRTAVRLLGVPAAAVALAERDRQVVVSTAGPDSPAPGDRLTPSYALCRHVVATGEPLAVADIGADERWRRIWTSAEGEPAAYAGVPLRAGVHVLGTLYAVDSRPRPWSAEQLDMLEDLAAMAEAEIGLRLARTETQETAAWTQRLLDCVPDAVISLDAAGVVRGWSTGAQQLFGWSASEIVGRPIVGLVAPERARRDYEERLLRLRESDAPALAGRGLKLEVIDRAGREFEVEGVAQATTVHGQVIVHAFLHEAGGDRRGGGEYDNGRRFLQALLDSLDVGVAACDPEGRLTVVNQPLRAGREQKPNLCVDDLPQVYGLLAADGRTPLAPHEVPLTRALAGESVDGQQLAAHLPGGVRRFLANSRPIDTFDGRRLGAVMALHDITDQHRTEILRSAQDAVNRVLADAATAEEAAVGTAGAIARALGWSCGEYWRVAEDQSGITRIGSWSDPDRELSAFADGDRSDSETFERGQGLPGRVWDTGRHHWIRDLLDDPDGFVREHEALRAGLRTAVGLPVRSGDRILGVLMLFADTVQEPDDDLVELLEGISGHLGRYKERRRAEELALALDASRRHFNQIIAQINDNVWSIEIFEDGRVRSLYQSQNAAGVFGRRLPDDADIDDLMLKRVHPDDMEAYLAFNRKLHAGEPAEIECRVVGLDEVTRWIWIRTTPRREGDRLLVDGIATDVTERHHIAEEREHLLAQQQQQVRRLRELDRMKDELMALVTHELRNPIGAIRGYVELLTDDPGLSAEQRMFTDVIDRKSAHLQRLVDDLLDLARMNAGGIGVDLRPLSLTGLLNEAIDDHRPAAEAKQLALTTELEPSLRLHADPVRLRQMLDNLLSNAIKYTPAGGKVTVSAGLGGDCGDAALTLTVADTGIGIPAEQYDRLFTRFFRASTAREAGIKGTGLGLAVTRAIVNAHGGTISAAPREGGGTVFTVCLPTVPPPPA